MSKITAFAAAVLSLSIGTARGQNGIQVTAYQVSETRVKRLVNEPGYKPVSTLSVWLRFKGGELAKATRAGRLKVEAAIDDRKTDLKRGRVVGSRLNRIHRPTYTSRKVPRDQYDYSVFLKAAARGATRIPTLKGQLSFSISETAGVAIPVAKLKGMIGKEIEDDVLKKAGLKVTLEKFTGTSVRVKFAGENRDRFLTLKFEDGQGKQLARGYAYNRSDDGRGTVSTLKDLPDGAVLKLVIETKRKDIDVKFDLKNIPLP